MTMRIPDLARLKRDTNAFFADYENSPGEIDLSNMVVEVPTSSHSGIIVRKSQAGDDKKQCIQLHDVSGIQDCIEKYSKIETCDRLYRRTPKHDLTRRQQRQIRSLFSYSTELSFMGLSKGLEKGIPIETRVSSNILKKEFHRYDFVIDTDDVFPNGYGGPIIHRPVYKTNSSSVIGDRAEIVLKEADEFWDRLGNDRAQLVKDTVEADGFFDLVRGVQDFLSALGDNFKTFKDNAF